MKLFELFDRTPFSSEVKKIEDILNKTDFSPDPEIEREGDVLDLELPTKKHGGGDAHFFQRLKQRKITGDELARAIKLGGRKLDREWLSSEESAEGEKVEFFDPQTKVFIPTIVKPNSDCINHPEENSVCDTKTGKAPKHSLIAKTIFKKGVPD